MFDKLIYYNEYGAGDLFESREFIKDIHNLIPAKKYYYAHGKSPRVFEDIPWLYYMPFDSNMQMRSPSKVINNCLYINTWIGRDSKYVLPQVGCVLEKSYAMFSDILKPYGVQLSKDQYEYLPEVDFNYFDTFKPETLNNILICNGHVQSHQAANFDFTDTIRELAKTYPDKTIYITTNIKDKPENVFYTGHVISTVDGFDLNEIAYLATFCDIVIGRKSGPAVFAHTKEFWNSDKHSLSFTYAKNSSHFVLSDHLPLHKWWSASTETLEVTKDCMRCINEG